MVPGDATLSLWLGMPGSREGGLDRAWPGTGTEEGFGPGITWRALFLKRVSNSPMPADAQ